MFYARANQAFDKILNYLNEYVARVVFHEKMYIFYYYVECLHNKKRFCLLGTLLESLVRSVPVQKYFTANCIMVNIITRQNYVDGLLWMHC